MITWIKLLLIIIYSTFCSVLALLSGLLDRSFNTYFLVGKLFSNGVLFIAGVKLKITGLENVDPSGTYVFVSNHSSQFDIPAVQKAVNVRISIIYKKELNKVPLFGWQLMAGPYVVVDRRNPEKAISSIQKAKQLMDSKKVSVLIFAEGTRSVTGEIQPFKRGAFYLASKVGYPIIPVTINGASSIMPKGKLTIKSGIMHVHFDKPIPTGNLKTRQDELNLMETVRNKIMENYLGVI
ncbi:MAG: lysophospholipid acyltransferase family protein [Ignavibacteriaceae bacterium]|nr:lysophospholipid acyltransferase family protein [Ignavibacteriaceae bacterium]